MLSITKISTQEQIEDLNKVLHKCRESNLVGSLKRFIKRPDGEYNEMVIKQVGFKSKFLININDVDGGWVYLDILSKRKSDIKQVQSLWETSIKRGTQCALEGKRNDYRLVIDLVADDLQRNTVYIMSFMQPMFISIEENNGMGNTHLFRLVFPVKNVFFGIEEMTSDEIDYEIASDRSNEYEDTTHEKPESDEIALDYRNSGKYS